MYTLSMQEKVTVVTALTEGNSIRSIERMTGIHRDTIMRLLVSTGKNCAALMDKTMRELPCRRVQCDEIWTYVGKKAKHVRQGESVELGDQWVFVALDADTKLVPAFLVGKRRVARPFNPRLSESGKWVPRPCVPCKGGMRWRVYHFVCHAQRAASRFALGYHLERKFFRRFDRAYNLAAHRIYVTSPVQNTQVALLVEAVFHP